MKPIKFLSSCLVLTLLFPGSLRADKAGGSDPSRFNNVDTWAGHVRLNVVTRYEPDSTGCSHVRHEREETIDAAVYLHLATPETMAPGSEAGDSALRVIWGSAGGMAPQLVTGTVRRSIREISEKTCETYRENLVTEGTENRRGGSALLFIMPAVTQMVSGEWLYGFSIPSETVAAKTRGTKSYLTGDSPPVWETEPVDESVTESFFMDIGPWEDATTVGVDSAAQRMQAEGRRMVQQLPQMSGFFDQETIREMQQAFSEMDEAVEEESEEDENPFKEAWARVPASGMMLQGSQSKRVQNGNDVTEVSLQWNFQPGQELEYELEVEIENYETWLPEADIDPANAGTTLVIHARLLEPGTRQPANIRAKKIIYTLSDVSREKGSAVNFPLASQDARPDLRFDVTENPPPHYQIDTEGLQLEDVRGDISTSKAVLSSFDWGGKATLKVEAVIEGPEGFEPRTTGYLKGEPSRQDILLPKRTASSWIAEKWKQDRGVAGKPDLADEDSQPKGDGHPGDGLSLYEEYRGFYIINPKTKKPEHQRGDPEKKELFVLNMISDPRAEDGIDLLANAAQLTIHRLDSTMLDPEKRLVNANHNGGAHLVDQHAVVLTEEAGQKNPEARGEGPGNPASCERVIMPPGTVKGWIRDYEYKGRKVHQDIYGANLAHEILHCINVVHHGQEDIGWVKWEFGHNKDGARVLYEWPEKVGEGTPTEIYPFFEGGGSAMYKILELRANTEGNVPLNVYIGQKGGEHSGEEQCLMRYDRARAYIREGRPDNFRYVIFPEQEWTGMDLCEKPQDSAGGVNNSSRQPWPRYGDASSGGNCRGQICISDAHGHRDR